MTVRKCYILFFQYNIIVLSSFLGDTLRGMLVGIVLVERSSVVFTAGKQPTVQPFGSRGGHTQRQSQSSGCRHTRTQRNPASVQDHQC